MGLDFSAGEIFEMACQIERNGARFYRKAAQASPQEAGQKLLELAAMEDDHERTFAAMKDELSTQERTEPIYDPENEAILYLRAFADSRVFDAKADPSERLTGKETLEEILKIAIGLEKDSIAFYLGMREMVPARLGKDKVQNIIRDEMGHVVTLSEELTSLSA